MSHVILCNNFAVKVTEKYLAKLLKIQSNAKLFHLWYSVVHQKIIMVMKLKYIA